MGEFLESEKPIQSRFKASSPSFSEAGRANGVYKRFERPFCLPLESANENLCSEFRQAAVDFFARRHIKWHDGQGGWPSNHLCDSQVSCVNFLFPFSHNQAALIELLRRVYPNAKRVISFDDDTYLTFEWIGLRDYLGEKDHARNKKRSRGANCTSADAAVLFEHDDGRKQMVLIEWKYTENYSPTAFYTGASGARRQQTYMHWLQADDSPLIRLPDYTVLYYEPFYQFMRQQLLAQLMERAAENKADVVSVLHLAPARNIGFNRVTSPQLRSRGSVATAVWKGLLREPDSFRSMATEELFRDFPARELGLEPWWNYISDRYAWILNPTALG